MVDVHLVLYEFDYREDEVCIAKPAEDIVEHREVLVLHASCDAMRERGEHDAWYVWRVGFHCPCHVESVVVCITRHTNHEVDVGILQHLVGFFRCAHLCECRRVSQSEVHILVKYFFVHTSVVFEHEGVVRVSHYKHVEDASCHEVHERHVAQIEFIPFLWYV